MDKAKTLVSALANWAIEQPHKPAFTYLDDYGDRGSELSYQQLDSAARRVAARLQTVGAVGDRALLLYPPGLDFVAAYLGCLYAGVVAVPAYPPRINRPIPRIQAIVEDAQPKIALTTEKIFESTARRFEQASDLAKLKWINTEALQPSVESGFQDVELHSESLAFLQYTSGSTSTPKGVMISHGNLMANVEMIDYGFQIDKIPDMGLIGGILTPIYKGGHTVLLSPMSFLQQPARWLQAITDHRGVITGAPNFAFDHCVEKVTDADLAKLDLSSIRLFFTGAEPIRPSSLEQFAEKFAPAGFRSDMFYPCYGMAETTLLVAGGIGAAMPRVINVNALALSNNRVEIVDQNPRVTTSELVSCGTALLDEKILIVDPDTFAPLGENKIGEIWVAGPHVGQGYWNRSKETEETFRGQLSRPAEDGSGTDEIFLRTGDLGFLNQNELFINGRIKDLLILNGRNHYPQDIELTVEESHEALEAGGSAAFSIDLDGQERLVVVQEVTRHGRKTDPGNILPVVRRAIAANHDLPLHELVLVSPMSIPKTSSGKIRRADTRRQFLEGSLQRIATQNSLNNSLPLGDVERWLVNALALKVKAVPESIDPTEPFAVYGLDSSAAVGLTGDLEQLLGRKLEATLAWDYPTPRLLAEHLTASGDVSALSSHATSPAGTAASQDQLGEPIAVIGLSLRFPDAGDVDTFWSNLVAGKDSISEVPGNRWNLDDFYAPEGGDGRMTTRWGGFLDDIAGFDAAFFGISPREATRLDPQQRLLLEVTWEALEHAGIPPRSLNGEPVGVFVGISSFDYSLRQFADPEQVDAYAGVGNAHSIAANRLSYQFNFRGPSVAVDTACSSSLVAIHQAANSLRLGESQVALAAGVNVTLAPELTIAFSQARMMAADGRCKTFDSRADGYVRGEGCGVLILKRLSDAQRDGDRILATILGSAINQDGRSNGQTAPNRKAQVQVIQQALRAARLGADKISYIEAHGTGTPLGDPIEIGALRDVFDPHAQAPLYVGSVKTNIGHLESAVGVAGTIKTILALRNELLPAHLNFESLNPYINMEGTQLAISSKGLAWPKGEQPRYAGVSSFGFGGTNAHLILSDVGTGQPESAPEAALPPLLTLSARSPKALANLMDDYVSRLAGVSEPHLGRMAQASQIRRDQFEFRIAQAAANPQSMIAALTSRRAEIEGLARHPADPRLTFLFTGQGAQWSGMGHELYQSDRRFRGHLDEVAAALEGDLQPGLLELLFEQGSAAQARLQQTQFTQVALFGLEIALGRYWLDLGLRPARLIGHSIGELAAACLADVFTLQDGCRLVLARGRLMGQLPAGGAMLAVLSEWSEIQSLVTELAPNCALAAVNTPASMTLSGPEGEIGRLETALNRQGIQSRSLAVSHAFHSALMDPILEAFRVAAAEIDYQVPAIPLFSNVDGQLMPPDFVPDADYLVKHIRATVQFASSVAAAADETDLFLEVGPEPVLSGLARRSLDPGERLRIGWATSLKADMSDREMIASALANLYENGVDIDWRVYHNGISGGHIDLPRYPFQHEQYWIEAETKGVRAAPVAELKRISAAALPVFEFEMESSSQSDWLPLVEQAVAQVSSGTHLQFTETHFFVGNQPGGRFQIALFESTGHVEFRLFRLDSSDAWQPLAHGSLAPGARATAAETPMPASHLIPAQAQNGRSGALKLEMGPNGAATQPSAPMSSDRERLLALVGDARADAMQNYLQHEIGQILGMRASAMDPEQSLDRMGIDSLTAVEFRNKVEKQIAYALPITRLLSGPTIRELSTEIAADLESGGHAAAAGVEANTEEIGIYPLTADQQAMWFLDELMPEGITFNVSGAVRIRGAFDLSALESALKAMMRRHTMLRTTFHIEDGIPVQQTHEKLELPFAVVDASRMTEQTLQKRMTWDGYRNFELDLEPAWRPVVYEISADETIALVAMQHTITDFWSMTIFAAELMQAYAKFAAGESWQPDPLCLKYSDFVNWEETMLAGEMGATLGDYWGARLAGPLPELELPKDFPRPPIQIYNGASVSSRLSPDLSAAIDKIALQAGVTTYIVLLSAFKTLMARFSGQTDVIVGSAMSGRNHPELEPLIGYFVNPVALRTDLSDDPDFDTVLTRVQQTVMEAFDHQDYPPANIADQIDIVRDASKPPVFSTTFIYQKAQFKEISDLNTVALGLEGATLNMSGLTVESAGLLGTPSQFDLTLMMADTSQGLAANFIYNSDLFSAETVERWLSHFAVMLEGITRAVSTPLSKLPLLDGEAAKKIGEFNATETIYPSGLTLKSMFEAQVERTPDRTALVFMGQALSYQDFNARANQLAHHLIEQGIGSESVVGLFMDRSLELLIGMYAIIKAGAAYVPLDPDYPAARLQGMASDAQAKWVVAASDQAVTARALIADAQFILFDQESEWQDQSAQNPDVALSPDNLAYIIFTSGSTGRPKGVMNEHRGIVNRLQWMQEAFILNENDRVLQKTPYSFDVSVWEFFWPLQVGATLVIAEPGGHKDPDYLIRTIQQEAISTIHFVPAMLQAFLQNPMADQATALSRVICSGEALPYDLQERFFDVLSAELHNLYGPTEAAVDVSHWVCRSDERRILPIGFAIANTQLYVLDSAGRELPIEIPGELYIGGVQVARGYVNRPALTAEKFIADPFLGPGHRLYRSGDLVKRLADGSIEFFGRVDFQIKIRGFRVELGEIESVLLAHQALRETVVVSYGAGERQQIVAYGTLNSGFESLDRSELHAFLRRELPEYMLPSQFIPLESLPLLSNGKVNRSLLPEPDQARSRSQAEYLAPRTPLEETLVSLCQDILELERIGIADSFFDLGGNSLQATRLLYLAREITDQPIPLRGIFEDPTVAGLATLIEGLKSGRIAPGGGQGLAPLVGGADLREDILLPDSFSVPEREPNFDRQVVSPKDVLLTGATGFLGAYLLDQLLTHTVANVHCIVRANSDRHGLQRVIENLQAYDFEHDDPESRLRVYLGDLSEPLLGLRSDQWNVFTTQLDSIYHNGAAVNFIAGYQQIRSANVGGAKTLLTLATTGRIKPLHFVSTLGQFNTNQEDDGMPISEIGYPDHLGVPLSGYTQTKWVADRILGLAQQAGAPVNIYRPGIISGDSVSGAWNHADMVAGLTAASVSSGQLPSLELAVDMAPVDYVAKAIFHISAQPELLGTSFHLRNPKPLAYDDLIDWFDEIGFPVEIVPFERWRQGLKAIAGQDVDGLWSMYLPLIEEIAEAQVFLPAISTERTSAALHGADINCPPVDPGLLTTYLSYFAQTVVINWGRIRPSDQKAPCPIAKTALLPPGKGVAQLIIELDLREAPSAINERQVLLDVAQPRRRLLRQ